MFQLKLKVHEWKNGTGWQSFEATETDEDKAKLIEKAAQLKHSELKQSKRHYTDFRLLDADGTVIGNL